jgi:hypothetical protein
MFGHGEWRQLSESMPIKRLGLLASVIWLIVSGLLASWNQTWIVAWRLYCWFTTDPACAGDTVFLVVHWGEIAAVVIYPLVLAWLVACGLIALIRRIRGPGPGV